MGIALASRDGVKRHLRQRAQQWQRKAVRKHSSSGHREEPRLPEVMGDETGGRVLKLHQGGLECHGEKSGLLLSWDVTVGV